MVKYVRLVTGEEVIAKIEEAEGKIKLTTPVRIVITGEGIGMGPVSPFIQSKDIEVAREHVVFIAEPDNEIKNAYNAQFGSGIITAPAGAIPPTPNGIDIVRD